MGCGGDGAWNPGWRRHGAAPGDRGGLGGPRAEAHRDRGDFLLGQRGSRDGAHRGQRYPGSRKGFEMDLGYFRRILYLAGHTEPVRRPA